MGDVEGEAAPPGITLTRFIGEFCILKMRKQSIGMTCPVFMADGEPQ
jgi:hypothetical protein